MSLHPITVTAEGAPALLFQIARANAHSVVTVDTEAGIESLDKRERAILRALLYHSLDLLDATEQ